MEFLSLGSVLQEYSSAIIVGVYTDKITVFSVKREGGKAVVVATAIEPQEGKAVSGDALDTERTALNCRKALAALPREIGNTPHDVIFAFGGGIGAFSVIHARGIREVKEKKISAEELTSLIAAQTQGKNEAVSRSFSESFHVDGFAVPDPVGLNGGEIVIDIARVACDDGLVRGLSQAAAGAGLSVQGFLDMRYAAAKYAKFFEGAHDSAIVLCVFEHETCAVLVRNRAVAGSGVVSVGYGIIIEAIEKTFSVGREEAKGIARAFTNKTLDARVSARVQEVCDTAGKTLIAKIAEAVSQLDPMSLLPGNIWVVSSEDIPHIDEAFRSSEWLASLPIERNAVVSVWRAPEHDAFGTAFDAIIAASL